MHGKIVQRENTKSKSAGWTLWLLLNSIIQTILSDLQLTSITLDTADPLDFKSIFHTTVFSFFENVFSILFKYASIQVKTILDLKENLHVFPLLTYAFSRENKDTLLSIK